VTYTRDLYVFLFLDNFSSSYPYNDNGRLRLPHFYMLNSASLKKLGPHVIKGTSTRTRIHINEANEQIACIISYLTVFAMEIQ